MFAWMTLLYLPSVPALVVAYLCTPADLGVLPRTFGSTSTFLGLLNALVVHVLLYFTQVMLFFHFTRSITLQYLCRFHEAKDKILTPQDLRAYCSPDRLLSLRLTSLVANNYAVVAGDRYRLTPKGRLFARAIALSRILFPVKQA